MPLGCCFFNLLVFLDLNNHPKTKLCPLHISRFFGFSVSENALAGLTLMCIGAVLHLGHLGHRPAQRLNTSIFLKLQLYCIQYNVQFRVELNDQHIPQRFDWL